MGLPVTSAKRECWYVCDGRNVPFLFNVNQMNVHKLTQIRFFQNRKVRDKLIIKNNQLKNVDSLFFNYS